MRHDRLQAGLILLPFLLTAGCADQPAAKPGTQFRTLPASPQSPADSPQTEQSAGEKAFPAPAGPARSVTTVRTQLSDNVYLEVARDELPLSLGYAGMVGEALLQAGWLAGHAAAGNLGPTAALPQQLHYCRPWREGNKRVVVIRAWVCLRRGYLEHFLSLPFKAHESILATILDAQAIHVGLLATGANPGKPVQWVNEKGEEDYRPPRGDEIKITLWYEDQGHEVQVPAQRWIRDSKTKKELNHHWIFAGSRLFSNLDDPQAPKFYAANDGRVICTANFTSALLDLSVASRPGDPTVGLDWEANSERIPPRDTTVLVVLEPLHPPGAGRK
jgi:hypothetical protein